jgi:hypothetical protein
MENNEEFKRVVASIKELEQQLLHIADKHLDQQGICVLVVKVGILFNCSLICI